MKNKQGKIIGDGILIFCQKKKTEYGSVVYLSASKEAAVYYAFLRLRKEVWEQIENIEDLYDEEEIGFIGLFKIYIKRESAIKDNKLIDLGTGEYGFLGIIPRGQNSYAWFEGPEWIDKTKELEEYRTHMEKTLNEIRENHELV